MLSLKLIRDIGRLNCIGIARYHSMVQSNIFMKMKEINDIQYCDLETEHEIMAKGRNSKIPKKANHGARQCSSVMRKLKRKGYIKRPNTRE